MQTLMEQKVTGLAMKLRRQRRKPVPRWPFVVCIGMLVASIAFISFRSHKTALAESNCTQGATLNVVAHEDDDLLFLNPDVLHAIQSGRCVRTIFVTAGDAGDGTDYWQSREAGSKAAYARMSSVANTWTQSDAGVSGHPIPLFTLTNNTRISLVFLRLPDGNLNGSGFARTNNESLQKLWLGSISTIHAVDGSSSYSKTALTSTLTSLMTSFQPDQIHTQDYVGSFDDGDHNDHHAVAYFTQAAHQQYTTAHTFTGYQDYDTISLPANVTGADLTAKQNAFFTYAQYDSHVCNSVESCAGTDYGDWLPRQYTVNSSGGTNHPPVADAGAHQTVHSSTTVQLDGSGSTDPDGNQLTYHWSQTGGPSVTLSSATAVQPTFTAPASPTTLTFQLVVNDGHVDSNPASVTITVSNSADLALIATATASSQDTSTDQTADKAIDGVVDGYPGDYTKEWATVGGREGSWLKLTWSSAQAVNRIVLYDRPNTNDQVTGGTLQFSNGSSVPVSALNNDGAATTISFSTRTITSVQFNISAVSASTENIGLAEIEVYDDSSGGANQPPVANAGMGQTVQINTSVQLDGSGSSDPDGDPLTYQWTQTAGPSVTLSGATTAQPTFTAPVSATTLTFQLVVNDGHVDSSPATVTITVSANANLALTATATASSQDASTGQTANKANDGVIDGYPGDYTKEWATVGGKEGSWLKLTWSSARTVSRIVLYDRPNGNDQITGGTIQFSDGSSVTIDALNNDGSAVSISFAARTITSIQLNITSVSASTENVGLAEIEMYAN